MAPHDLVLIIGLGMLAVAEWLIYLDSPRRGRHAPEGSGDGNGGRESRMASH